MPAQAPDRGVASDTDSELVQDDAVASTSDVASSPDTPYHKYPWLKKWVQSLRSRVRKWTNSRVYTAVYRSGPARAVRASLSLRSALAITVAALGVIT
ncbi:MAG: two-component sensor histidine kinase, partial [Actinomycetaceae bacterium UMB1218B]|nr:two-component sensor histidine kinase [Actinomycetaceae bacterium UMB1218B]